MNVTITYPGSAAALAGGTSQTVALADTSPHQSIAVGGNTAVGSVNAIIYWATAPTFIRGGANPTVTTDGTDPAIPANTMVRIDGLKVTDKLSIAAITGTGAAYITPL
jgi:hypothetical protein